MEFSEATAAREIGIAFGKKFDFVPTTGPRDRRDSVKIHACCALYTLAPPQGGPPVLSNSAGTTGLPKGATPVSVS